MSKINWGEILPPAVSSATSFISQLFNRNQERKEYDRMLRYNHPKAQMERFREAGLSPYLIYGQGSAGNVSSPSPAQAVPETGALDKYMGYNQFRTNQRLASIERHNMLLQGEILANTERSGFVDSIRKQLELYSDFPDMVGKSLSVLSPQDLSQHTHTGFRRKINEMKLATSKATVEKIMETIQGLRSDNVVRGVKAGYARDYGMVGGDWTQGLGLVKSLSSSLPRFFKSRSSGSEKALIDAYRKFKGDQNKRDANRFLFEQLK